MARNRGGSGADTPAGIRGGPDDGAGVPRRRTSGGRAGNVADGHEAVQAAFTAGRANSSAGNSAGNQRTADPVTSTVTGQPLPPGYRYAPNGRLQGPDGRWANDPTAPPTAHNRETEYPSGYRQPTHDAMTRQYTEEGQLAGGPPRHPVTGERIPRDQLTWYDRRGRPVPADELTYEHHRPVVQHWNDEGRFTSRSERNDWYNNPDNLSPMSRSENSRGGSLMQDRYIQETGPEYSNDSSND